MKITEILTELIGIKGQLKTLSSDDNVGGYEAGGNAWYDIMTHNGFSPIGAGLNASVWKHPKLAYVLKLFNSDDQAYIDWVSVAMKHKNNPHMPKFISKRLIRITPNVVAIRMESLRHLKTEIEHIVYQFSDRKLLSNYSELPSQSFNNVKEEFDEWQVVNNYCQRHPLWLEALDITWNFIKTTGHENDFHSKNCMVRDPDTLVITDPVV